jgi:AraC-like DNA-binding protein
MRHVCGIITCAVILTTLPDLPPRPATAANAEFRRRFYERWGRENAIVCGRAQHAEYLTWTQTLSIKTVAGGRERYALAHREVVVDDDNWLVLNEGSRYGSVLAGPRPAFSFCVFFRPGLAEEVAAAAAQRMDRALDQPAAAARAIGFDEHLRPHDGEPSRRLAAMARTVRTGERDETWLEQELTLLAAALLAEPAAARVGERGTTRAAQRTELRRRLRLGADFIESHYPEPLMLAQMAAAAYLSRYHFVREFAREFGLSPHAYLVRKRARAARRWLADGVQDRAWIAAQCGFGSRWSMRRALASHPQYTP